MKDDSVISLEKPESNCNNHLAEMLRHGFARILWEALEVEIEPNPANTGHEFLENSGLFESLLLNSEAVISPSDECGLKSL